MADTDTKPLAMTPQASLFVMGYLRWDATRAGMRHRAAALDALAGLLKQLNEGPTPDSPRYFLLDGQTALIEEVADLRPDLQALLLIFNAGGKLGLGPWYTQIEETLVSGESLVRNLLMSRVMAQRHGVKLAQLAFVPDARAHIRQLPQILRGFGIGLALLHQDSTSITAPFRWMSPDGSSLLVLTHSAGDATSDTAGVVAGIELQKALRPDGPYLWLLDAGAAMPSLSELEQTLAGEFDVPVAAGEPGDYLRALRYFLADDQHPAFGGDLDTRLPRSLSARLYLKQMNTRTSARLTTLVEPLLTVALTHGRVAQPENARALLNYAWRDLLHCQQHDLIGGSADDDTHTRQEMAFREVEEASDHLIQTTLDALPGTPHRIGHVDESLTHTYVMVWNGHNWPVKQMVTLDVSLPPGRHPARLRVPDTNDEVLFSWQSHTDDTGGGRLSFLADVPGLGYACYTLDLSDQPPGPHVTLRVEPGTTIGSITGETFSATGGKLAWKRMTQAGERVIEDVLRYVDGGDAGDTFQYQPPTSDRIVEASLSDALKIESSPLYERLWMQHRLRIAPGLDADGTRGRGLRRLDLHTSATFYHHMPGLYFHTHYENNAEDHRLRAHIRTGIPARTLLARGAYGFSKHLTGRVIPADTLVAVTGRNNTLALLSNGLPEVEGLNEDGKTTLALTLLRAVGRTGRPMNSAVEGAQCLRSMQAAFALKPVTRGDNAALLRAAAEYTAPPVAFQYDTRPERPRRSYLSVISDMADGSSSDGEGVIVTALKPPQKGPGWVVRLFNPHEHPVEVLLTPHTRADFAQRVTLAEEPVHHIDMDANGRIAVTVKPQQIATVRIRFARNSG